MTELNPSPLQSFADCFSRLAGNEQEKPIAVILDRIADEFSRTSQSSAFARLQFLMFGRDETEIATLVESYLITRFDAQKVQSAEGVLEGICDLVEDHDALLNAVNTDLDADLRKLDPHKLDEIRRIKRRQADLYFSEANKLKQLLGIAEAKRLS